MLIDSKEIESWMNRRIAQTLANIAEIDEKREPGHTSEAKMLFGRIQAYEDILSYLRVKEFTGNANRPETQQDAR